MSEVRNIDNTTVRALHLEEKYDELVKKLSEFFRDWISTEETLSDILRATENLRDGMEAAHDDLKKSP